MLRTLSVPLVAILLAGATWTSPRAHQAAPPDFSALEGVVRKELAAANVPGAAVAVVHEGRVVYARGFGVANVETGEPMRPEMLFRLGSTTKMITAAAVVLLAEQGRLSLTEPISRYIPNLHPSIGRLTAHQLLSHQSGILDEAPMFGSHDDGAMKTEIESWTADKFFAEPGEIYSYSNPGYWLAGRLAEAVGGRPFADQVAETIFTPLGMTRSTFRPTLAMTYPLAQGHEIADGKPRIIRPAADNSASWPAGSIFSNVMDLTRWMMAVVDSGQIGGEQVLPPGLFATLLSPRVQVPGTLVPYGYGVQLGHTWGTELVVEHGGSRAGYGSTIRMMSSRRLGVVVLANRTGAGLPLTASAAMSAVLGPRPMRDAVLNGNRLPDAELAALAGTYSQAGNAETVVTVVDGALNLRQGTREVTLSYAGIPVSPVAAPRHRRFTADGAVYVFVLDEGGRARFLHTGGRSRRKVQ